MEEKNITEQESLAIIQQMIATSKRQLIDSSKYFLLWGIAVFVCAVAQYVMLKLYLLHTQYVWFAMPIIAIIHILIAMKQEKAQPVKTHNSIAMQGLWVSLGISFFIVAYLSGKTSFNCLPIMILLYGVGTFTTGKIIEFKPLIVGGITCFILSVGITFIDGAEQLLIVALAVLVSYIIPAVLLKKEFNNQQKIG